MMPSFGSLTLSSRPFDRLAPVLAHQELQAVGELALHRLLAEDHAGDRDHDQQQRRDGKEGVVRERRAHARRVVVRPGLDRRFGELPALLQRQVHAPERAGSVPGAAGGMR
jgi:hypothetical protein